MLLAVDTSTRWIGLALYDGTAVLNEQVWLTKERHTVELATAVTRILDQTGIKAGRLNALAAATGPGSFTSLRIGLALVKGMALTLKIPLIGIPSLDILAGAMPASEYPLLAVLQAGRGRLAAIQYRFEGGAWQSVGDPIICDTQGLFLLTKGPTLVVGELDQAQRHTLSDRRKHILLGSPAQCLRRPSYLAEMAWKRLLDGSVDDPLSLSPIYIHVADPLPE